jgi:acyl-CoA thioesterase I
MTSPIRADDLILFQGDSITDAGRCGTGDGLGNGYVCMVRAMFTATHPDLRVRIANRGVGGDRTTELLARWRADCLEVRPQVLSIKIGVNDVWRLRGEWNGQKYVPLADYRANYETLIAQAKEAGVRVLALVSPTTIAEENDSELARQLDERTACVRELAAAHGAVYVPAREAILRALKDQPGVRWTTDGCHPTQAGHALIAATWMRALGQ